MGTGTQASGDRDPDQCGPGTGPIGLTRAGGPLTRASTYGIAYVPTYYTVLRLLVPPLGEQVRDVALFQSSHGIEGEEENQLEPSNC